MLKIKHFDAAEPGMSEQYNVKFTVQWRGLTTYSETMFCVTNSRCAHKQVKAYAQKWLNNEFEGVINITSVEYC